jgi:hypothetical protein
VSPRRNADLVRGAIDDLAQHEAALPSLADTLKALYLLFLAGLDNPANLPAHSGQGSGSWIDQQGAAMLLEVPWERGRALRLANAVFAGRIRAAETGWFPPLPGGLKASTFPWEQSAEQVLSDWLDIGGGTATSPDGQRLARLLERSWMTPYLAQTSELHRGTLISLCRVRAARLQAALVLYEIRKEKAAPDLQSLVPDILPELPDDPFSGRPFRYRISRGEGLGGPGEKEVQEVLADQGIVWSIGPDRVDDGGLRQADQKSSPAARGDLIFLVPRRASGNK